MKPTAYDHPRGVGAESRGIASGSGLPRRRHPYSSWVYLIPPNLCCRRVGGRFGEEPRGDEGARCGESAGGVLEAPCDPKGPRLLEQGSSLRRMLCLGREPREELVPGTPRRVAHGIHEARPVESHYRLAFPAGAARVASGRLELDARPVVRVAQDLR